MGPKKISENFQILNKSETTSKGKSGSLSTNMASELAYFCLKIEFCFKKCLKAGIVMNEFFVSLQTKMSRLPERTPLCPNKLAKSTFFPQIAGSILHRSRGVR
jgi:hypothetical protein